MNVSSPDQQPFDIIIDAQESHMRVVLGGFVFDFGRFLVGRGLVYCEISLPW